MRLNVTNRSPGRCGTGPRPVVTFITNCLLTGFGLSLILAEIIEFVSKARFGNLVWLDAQDRRTRWPH
jgi:hypothetical protein